MAKTFKSAESAFLYRNCNNNQEQWYIFWSICAITSGTSDRNVTNGTFDKLAAVEVPVTADPSEFIKIRDHPTFIKQPWKILNDECGKKTCIKKNSEKLSGFTAYLCCSFALSDKTVKSISYVTFLTSLFSDRTVIRSTNAFFMCFSTNILAILISIKPSYWTSWLRISVRPCRENVGIFLRIIMETNKFFPKKRWKLRHTERGVVALIFIPHRWSYQHRAMRLFNSVSNISL